MVAVPIEQPRRHEEFREFVMQQPSRNARRHCALVVACVATLALGVGSVHMLAQSAPPDASAPSSDKPHGIRTHISGIVLYADPALGVFVDVAHKTITVLPSHFIALAPGDRIEASGEALDQRGRSTMNNAEIVRVRAGDLPPARRLAAPALARDRELDDWVEFESVVREVLSRPDHTELRFAADSGQIVVIAPPLGESPDSLVDAVVRVRGVRQEVRNNKGAVVGVRVLSAQSTEEHIVTPAAAAPFDLPVRSVAEVREIASHHKTDHRVRMRATVLLRQPSMLPDKQIVHVQDASGALAVELGKDVETDVGEQVDVAGFPTLLFGTPLMSSGSLQRLGAGTVPAPMAATAADLMSGRYSGQLVRLRATLLESSTTQNAQLLKVESGGTVFSAYVYDWPGHGPTQAGVRDRAPTNVERIKYQQKSVLELTGVSAIFHDDKGAAKSMTLVVRGPEAIALIEAPSWWTAGHLAIVALSAIGVGVLALVWVGVLNARVRHQTRALADQFEHTAALQRRWSDLVATASDVIVTWDLHGRILSLNKTGQALTGFTEESVCQRTMRDLVVAQSIEAVDALMRRTDSDVSRETHELELIGADGNAVPLEINVQPMFENRSHVGFQGIGRNVAAHKRIQQALREARDAAEDANRAKSEFLANMSHEIRTPMNGIIGMTELALTTELTMSQREYLDTVKMSAESLLGLLNGILDFSKIESRKLEIESVPFALRDLVNETLKPLSFKAHQKGLELLFDVAPTVPDALVGDPLRLRQIVTNLIGNALKFTDAGHVLVSIREEVRGDRRTTLHVSVADTGCGIPQDKQALIFEPFSQADGSTTRRYGGTGLGLAISSTLVSLMGGRIWVESEPGAGSAFHFTASFDVTAEVEPAAIEPHLAGVRVLIVDDNAVNRRILAEQLARYAMKATLVEGGREAIEALKAAMERKEQFSLVLLDAHMPEVDGFAVAEYMCRRPELANATVMMLTSGGQYGDADRCKAFNISAYLTKPIAPKHLLDVICRMVAKNVAMPAVVPAVPAPADAATSAPVPPRRKRKVLLAEDNVVNQKVAVGLLTKRGHEVFVAVNGKVALEMLSRDTFDLILMDVQMPEMGGFETTAVIRQREAVTGGHIRIVAMTAHTMNGDREQCLESGMDDYLSKPVNPAILYAAVESETLSDADPATNVTQRSHTAA